MPKPVVRGPALSSPLVVRLPIETIVEANAARQHGVRAHMRRKKSQRATAWAHCRSAMFPPPALPVVAVMIRASSGMPDEDNLPSATKAVRDGIADWLCVDDGDVASITWIYRSIRGARATHPVTLELHARPPGPPGLVTPVFDALLAARELGARPAVLLALENALAELGR